MAARWSVTLPILLLIAPPLAAQSEADLKRYFEGKRVVLRIDMPGTEQGVDVYPGTDRPLDYPRYASRLKDHGTAMRAGDVAMITKIRVKSSHIEFQLDGGGYGTMGDETSTSVHVGSAPKSTREKNLEAEVKRVKDPVRRREMQEELDDLRKAREREDARNRAEVADAEEQKKENLRQRRISGGSRFNVRYRDALPAEVLTPQGLEASLAEYVTFPTLPVNAAAAGSAPMAADSSPARSADTGPKLPRKGMSVIELEDLLGDPVQTTERAEGTLRVVTRTYRVPDGRVTADFVEDVLVRYSMTSE